MKRLGFLALAAATTLSCQADNKAVSGELAEIKKELGTIKEMIAKGGGGRGNAPQRPQPKRPSPTDVYALDITGDAFEGAKDAKVTVVEAFEFA